MTDAITITPMDVAPVPRIALRAPEAAAALGVSEATLRTWTSKGIVPSRLIRGTRLYSVDGLRQWVAEHDDGEEVE